MTVHVKHCKWCNNEFEDVNHGKGKHRVYCDNKCAKKGCYAARAKPEYSLVCRTCGTSHRGSTPDKKYCSHSCQPKIPSPSKGKISRPANQSALCKQCLLEKEPDQFYVSKGALESSCKACRKKEIADRLRQRLDSDPEFRARNLQWKKEYRNSPKGKALKLAYHHNRKAVDKDYAVRCRIACQIRSCVKNRTTSEVFSFIGYSIDQLTAHLESLFHEGMTWDLFNASEIHIDHIIPKRIFDHTVDQEIKDCWSLENLRPMWRLENIVKSDQVSLADVNPSLWQRYGHRLEENKVHDDKVW